MPAIKIIFFDIDDTLMRKEDGYLPPELPSLMQALKAQGIITAIATGRSLSIIPQALWQLIDHSGIDIISAANGQIALQQGKTLHEHPIAPEDLAQLIALAERKGWGYLLHGRNALAVSRLDKRVMPAMYSVSPWFVNPHLHQQEAIHQFGYFITQTEAADLPQELAKLPLSDQYIYTPWHEYGCDLIPSQGSKARGIREICTSLGIELTNAAAFGDGLNDIEMLQTVGLGIAMGNACPELKAVADYITTPLMQQGIKNALSHFQLI